MSNNYYRPGFGQQFASSMIGRLILINVVVFLLQNVFPPINNLFALIPRAVVQNFYVWQLFTYMFLHGSFGHLFWNMFALWMFGSAVESVWGSRHFLRYYLICGLAGAVFGMIFNYNNGVIGASGAIFGVLIAYAVMFPDSYIYLWFLVPVRAKYFVAGFAALQIVLGVSGPEGIAYFVHLGGAVAGLFFFRHQLMQRAKFNFGAKRRWKSYVDDRNKQETQHETDNIDSILDKISAKGYENLSTTEKRILENYSRKRKEENE